MIRKLLATTAVATLISTGALAQTDTTQQPAQDPAASTEGATTAPAEGEVIEEGAAPQSDDGSATAQQDPAATGAETPPAETETAQDPAAAPADPDMAQDPAAAPADDSMQAQDGAQPSGDVQEAQNVTGYLASTIIGETVYNGSGEGAENIGDVNDIVITQEGEVEAIVVGVGGFLGIGEHSVALEFDSVEWAEMEGDAYIVVPTTKEDLQAMPAFDRNAYERDRIAAAGGGTATDDMAAGTSTTGGMTADPAAPAATDDMAATEQPATTTTEQPAADTAEAPAAAPVGEPAATTDMAATEQPATTDTATAEQPATDATQTAAIDRSTLTEVDMGQMRSEDLVGTTVYGANEEQIGEVGDIILSQEGQVDAILVDVGGFLGMGEKEVAIGMDNLQFMADANNNMYLYTTFTKEQLEGAQAYDEAAYAESRDNMRLQMQ